VLCCAVVCTGRYGRYDRYDMLLTKVLEVDTVMMLIDTVDKKSDYPCCYWSLLIFLILRRSFQSVKTRRYGDDDDDRY
jgi:hypothetical protein